jgi:hypothetical protein
MKKLYLVCLLSVFTILRANAQIIVVPDTNVVQLVNNFILSGVTVSNIQYTGETNTIGQFSGGAQTNLGMDNGIAMTTGSFDTTVNVPVGAPVSQFANFSNNGAGDPMLSALVGANTYDASVLEFDLVPVGNVLEFQYVFASEEYPEWVGSLFNDVFGFFISGPDTSNGVYVNENIAIIPGTSLPVAINNVNSTLNHTFFVDNETLNGQTIVFDGFTTVLIAQIFVVPSATYHLKMAVADVSDGIFDSAIFLKAQSMKSYFSAVGVSELEQASVVLYPNPADENLYIQTGSYPVTVNIVDMAGKTLQSGILGSASEVIDVSGLNPGFYIVKTIENSGKVKTSQLLIQ